MKTSSPLDSNVKAAQLATLFTIIGGGILLALLIWISCTRNPVTPAGYVGYLTRGALVGKTRFIALQNGPTSAGRGWLLDVLNVSVTPYTYTEDFTGGNSVLSRDNLQVAFSVHLVWRVRPTGVKQFVEQYSTLQAGQSPDAIVETAYRNFLREPLRTYARDEVQKLDGLAIKERIVPTGDAVLARVRELCKDTPFEVSSVVVGNIQYPREVADAVAQKLAATQELERKVTEIEIVRREKEKRIVEAEGIARAMEIVNERLTPTYLQYEAIKAQTAMVGSPNHTTIYIPVGPMGVPLVSNLNPPSTSSPAPPTTGAEAGDVPAPASTPVQQ